MRPPNLPDIADGHLNMLRHTYAGLHENLTLHILGDGTLSRGSHLLSKFSRRQRGNYVFKKEYPWSYVKANI